MDSDRSGIRYSESVEEIICFGWIDGLINSIDDERYKRRFTPRKPDSKWSKKNKERVQAMVEEATRIQPIRFSQRIQRFSGDLLEEIARQYGYAWDSVGLVIFEGAIVP